VTQDELREKIRDMKVAAFDRIKNARSMDPKTLGFNTRGEMAMHTIEITTHEIDQEIKAFEKANPR
jgi:hypothetical protein